MANFTKDKPPTICPDSLNAYQKPCQFEKSGLIWTDTFYEVVENADKTQVISLVMPFEYHYCPACHWKAVSSIIGDKEVMVYSGVTDDKNAISQMVGYLKNLVREGMIKALNSV